MQFQVYKCWGCLNNNIDVEIIDVSVIVLIKSGFQKSGTETHD
jgi:hypothetical protein